MSRQSEPSSHGGPDRGDGRAPHPVGAGRRGRVGPLGNVGPGGAGGGEVTGDCRAPSAYESDVITACLAGGPRAVATRGCAARLLGVGRPYFDDARVEVGVPPGGSTGAARSVGALVRVYRHLDERDRCRIGAVPAVSAPRLIVDLLDADPVEALYAVADDLLARRWTTAADVRHTWAGTDAGHREVLEAVLLPWDGARPGRGGELVRAAPGVPADPHLPR